MDFQVLPFSNVSIDSDRVSCVDSTGLNLAPGRAQNTANNSEESGAKQFALRAKNIKVGAQTSRVNTRGRLACCAKHLVRSTLKLNASISDAQTVRSTLRYRPKTKK